MNITKQHYHYYHHQHHINSSATSNIHTQTLNVCWKHCVLCYPTLCMMQLCSPALTVDNSHEYAEWSICSLSLRSVSRRRSRLHECTPCRSIPSASPCRRQAKIERAQIHLCSISSEATIWWSQKHKMQHENWKEDCWKIIFVNWCVQTVDALMEFLVW